MPRNKPKVWTDGIKGAKTSTNPKGGGRVPGRRMPHLVKYPGILSEQRLAWNRMKAQAKFRHLQGRPGELWSLTWEEFLAIWDRKWHRRGNTVDDLVLTKRDQAGHWHVDNLEIVPRLEQYHRQHLANRGKKYKRKPPNE